MMDSLRDGFLHPSLSLYTCLAELENSFSFYEDDNQLLLKSGIDNPYFNFLLIKNPQNTTLSKAFEFFGNLPFECTFRKDDLFLTAKCQKQGLVFGEDSTRMSINLMDSSYKLQEDSNITVKRVKNDRDMHLWVNITALGFRLSRNYIKGFFYPIFLAHHKSFRFSLCFLNDIPTVASIFFLNPPYATIFSLASRPQFRKQGLASYFLQTELRGAKNEGITNCHVQASIQGKTLYEKLGFQIEEELITFIYDKEKP